MVALTSRDQRNPDDIARRVRRTMENHKLDPGNGTGDICELGNGRHFEAGRSRLGQSSLKLDSPRPFRVDVPLSSDAQWIWLLL